MRIKSLAIRGYKSLREFEIDEIPDFVVFAGPNGSGKSAIFDAIALLKEVIGPYHSWTIAPVSVNLGCAKAEIAASFVLSDAEAKHVRDLFAIDVEAGVPLQASIQVIDQQITGVESHRALPQLLSLYEPGGPLGIFEHITAHRRMAARTVQQVSLARLAPDESKQFRLSSLENKFESLKDQLAALALEDLFLWQETGEPRDSLASLKELFHRLFASKRFLRVLPSRDGVRFDIETPDGVHDIDLLSSGEKEVFMVFATLLLLAPQSSVIMYDEPELHLHGAVERQIAGELLRLSEVPNQILVTTHSIEFIGATSLASVFHVEPYAGQNQVHRVSEEQGRLEVFEALGASVGLQLISRKVAFLEGEAAGSDKQILSTLFPELTGAVAFVPSQSVTNVMEIAGRTTDLLAKGTRYGTFFCVRDRDYLTDEQRADLMGRFAGLMILNRYHIENYLLDAAAIAKVMGDLVATPNDPDAVRDALKAIAEELKDEAVAGWVRYQLDYALRGLLVKAGGTDPLGVLKSSANKVRIAVDSSFTPDAIDELASGRRVALDKLWPEGGWLKEIPGRDILRRFGEHYTKGIDGVSFRNLVAARLSGMASEAKDELRELLAPLF